VKFEQGNPYEARIARVCDYIEHNLDEDLTLDALSRVAVFSKYHFHRMFSAFTGLSVARFIQMSRLKRASFQLAFHDEERIIDIALKAGFESPEAFSRAFKRAFGQTPSHFRADPAWPSWHAKFSFTVPRGPQTMNVKIVDFSETNVALIEHRGSPDRVYDTAAQFIEWRKATGLSPVTTSRTYGIPYSDPKLTEPADFRFDICGSTDEAVPPNAQGVKSGVIPGGRCATVRHHGSHDNLEDSIYHLYRDWLPVSGEETRDFPCFFHYHNFVHEVDECDLVTDVYLPLK
jgi:AraC family transcriptional regulator